MNILLCNDDGIRAPGIIAMREALCGRGHEVSVVAPDGERSASGHAITWQRPFRVRKTEILPGIFGWAVDGTPADCARIGIMEVFPQADFVVSGINLGANTGIDTLYSGTVAAALEGVLLGIPAMAVSVGWAEEPDYPAAAGIAADMLEHLAMHPMPEGMLCNLNVPPNPPAGQVRGVRLAPLNGNSLFAGFKRISGEAADTWYATRSHTRPEPAPGSDWALLAEGYATVTYLGWSLAAESPGNPLPAQGGERA